jgi:hypothetical protein
MDRNSMQRKWTYLSTWRTVRFHPTINTWATSRWGPAFARSMLQILPKDYKHCLQQQGKVGYQSNNWFYRFPLRFEKTTKSLPRLCHNKKQSRMPVEQLLVALLPGKIVYIKWNMKPAGDSSHLSSLHFLNYHKRQYLRT